MGGKFMGSERDSKTALVMYSGGLDSFLTTIKLIYCGYDVRLISFDNGSTIGMERVFFEAQKLIDTYGEKRVKHVGVYSIWGWKHRLSEHFKYSNPSKLMSKYPNIPYYQLECLCCHTAMYVYAIAYCKSHNISVLAEGARVSQGFIVEVPKMLDVYKNICTKNNIELLLPVLDIPDDNERALELEGYGFVPKTYEPQCTLGLPLKHVLTDVELLDLVNYFNDNLLEIVYNGIERMEPILKIVSPGMIIENSELVIRN